MNGKTMVVIKLIVQKGNTTTIHLNNVKLVSLLAHLAQIQPFATIVLLDTTMLRMAQENVFLKVYHAQRALF